MPVVIARERFDAVVLDLDGVVTDTASVHLRAWKRLFDEFLPTRGDPVPFSAEDYERYVDGRPRYDGVTGLLRARGVELPHGAPDDPEDAETVCGLGNRKDRYFREQLEAGGATAFPTTVALLDQLRAAGLGLAIISASRNCASVLDSVGLLDAFDARVDGEVAAALGLPGKPDPAVFLEAARRLGAAPERTVVVEDAEPGVRAGRVGGFGLVIGVDRTGHADALRREGADVVVRDLGEVTVEPAEARADADAKRTGAPADAGSVGQPSRAGGEGPGGEDATS